jgi:DNA-binding SARP family transcriptional activator
VATFKVRLFGKFNAHQDDRALDCFPSAKAKELFCYLLLHRDRPHPRETLATLFWGECSPEQTRKYLRQTLWQLQHALHGICVGNCLDVLRVDKGTVLLDSGSDLWLDVNEFEQAFVPAKGIAGEKMDEACACALRNAVSLYEGNLLEGWYQDWCLYHRERLENTYLSMLDKLMAYCELQEEYEAGISYGERLLMQDRARERTYCRLMRMRYFAGDRAGALREFQRCEVALKEELSVAPAKQTVELRQQICADLLSKQLDTASVNNHIAGPLQTARRTESASSVFRGLHRLRSVLLKMQHRVELDIQEVNSILDSQPSSSAKQKH